ncbi:MAG: hypothetical protein ACJ75I_12090 [Solirubrobacterales bacterium]
MSVAIVTGSDSGIGKSSAVALAKAGSRPRIHGLDLDAMGDPGLE